MLSPTDWFKIIQIFFYTPMVYLGWYYLLLNSPDLALDNSPWTITIFWICNALVFILVFTLIYSIFFKYYQSQNHLNRIQIRYFVGTSLFSVFFWVGIFFWRTFIFYSPDLPKALTNLAIFSAAILGSIGVIQLWFSVCAIQLAVWIKSRPNMNQRP